MTNPAVVRLTTPAHLAASLPVWLGFTPTHSLVVVCCGEPRGRVGLTLRFDLPEPAHTELLVHEVLRRVHLQPDTTRLLLAVYDEPSLAHEACVAAIREGLDGVVLIDALRIHQGRYWSYLCEDESCCPSGGTVIPEPTGPVAQLAAELTVRGTVQYETRDALAVALAAPPRTPAMEQLLAESRSARELAADHERLVEQEFFGWLDAISMPVDLDPSPERAAFLVASLANRHLRDQVLAVMIKHLPEATALLSKLLRIIPTGHDAALATMAAWLAYVEGGGAAVGLLLDRALATDPSYSLALLFQTVLDNQIPPERVRELTLSAAAP